MLEGCDKLRKKIIDTAFATKSGHIGGALSVIDILYTCFFKTMNDCEELILSKGHSALALYVCLNEKGVISDEELSSFYKDGTVLPAHPSSFHYKKDIPFGLGSLGHGLSLANGVALANRLNGKDVCTYVVMSDGETNEGSVWEAANFAVANKLNKLISIIDKNKLQAFGYSNEVLGDTASKDKWETIGFEVVEVDGHSIEDLRKAIKNLKNDDVRPKLIIANTIKGKGIDFMENELKWHYIPMKPEEYDSAVKQLKVIVDA
ncbi:MAG: transketolase [Bacteroidales bacterium]|jgi:transketolase|nr:transketolase [Bacteroidales bacterium]